MTYATKQTPPLDEEIAEEWNRDIADPNERSVHGVCVTKELAPQPWRWRVSVYAMEHVRDVPLERELRREIAKALRAVPEVIDACEEDREVWRVNGAPTGRALVDAVAAVVDARGDEIRAYLARG